MTNKFENMSRHINKHTMSSKDKNIRVIVDTVPLDTYKYIHKQLWDTVKCVRFFSVNRLSSRTKRLA